MQSRPADGKAWARYNRGVAIYSYDAAAAAALTHVSFQSTLLTATARERSASASLYPYFSSTVTARALSVGEEPSERGQDGGGWRHCCRCCCCPPPALKHPFGPGQKVANVLLIGRRYSPSWRREFFFHIGRQASTIRARRSSPGWDMLLLIIGRRQVSLPVVVRQDCFMRT